MKGKLIAAALTLLAVLALAWNASAGQGSAGRRKSPSPKALASPSPSPAPTFAVEEVPDHFEESWLSVAYQPMHLSFSQNVTVAPVAGSGVSTPSASTLSASGFSFAGLALLAHYNALEGFSANLDLGLSSRDVQNEGALQGTTSSATELHIRLDVDYSFYQEGETEMTGGLGAQLMRVPYYSAPDANSVNFSVATSTQAAAVGVFRFKRKLLPQSLTSATLALGFPFLLTGASPDSLGSNGGFLATLMVEHKKNFGIKGKSFLLFDAGLVFETLSYTQSAPFTSTGSFHIFEEQLRAGVGMML